MALAYASSAEVAARVAGLLGDRASPDTFIRRQRAEPFVFTSPRVLGVDDFALRRGCTYGTLLVDVERHQPVAGLEGRTAEPLMQWLQAPPSVTILVCDRADAYALAGRQAVPEALQVADRFQLVRNVGDALNALLPSRRWQHPILTTPPEMGRIATSAPPASAAEAPGETLQPTPRKRIAWEAVQERRGLGQSLRQIAQALGVDRRTVRKSVAMAHPPVYPGRRPRATPLTPDMDYWGERWAQGCPHARRLYQELVHRGYHGAASMVRQVLQPWRARPEASSPTLTSAQRTWLLLRPAAHLTDAAKNTLESVLHANPTLADGYTLKTHFQTLLTQQDRAAFDPWLQKAETSALPSFQTVARSFRQDDAAISAALTTPGSTGQCEGQLCRVQLIKRLGYGRAQMDLRRQRSWHRMSVPVRPVKPRREVKHPAAA